MTRASCPHHSSRMGRVGARPGHGGGRHLAERRLGVVGVQLVEVHVAGWAGRPVLVRCDHREVIGARPRRCRGCGRSRPSRGAPALSAGERGLISTSSRPRVGLARHRPLAGSRVVVEAEPGDVGRAPRDHRSAARSPGRPRPLRGRRTRAWSGEVGAERHTVGPPARPMDARQGQELGHAFLGVALRGPVGHLEVDDRRDPVFHPPSPSGPAAKWAPAEPIRNKKLST